MDDVDKRLEYANAAQNEATSEQTTANAIEATGQFRVPLGALQTAAKLPILITTQSVIYLPLLRICTTIGNLLADIACLL